MAISEQIQMLFAAFSFGLLFQAATAAVLLYFKGHGATIFKDRRRLALVTFLSSSAFWAQIDFVNFAIPTSSPAGCQVTVIVSTLFDQVARVTIGGFLLWSVGHVTKPAAEKYGLGALIGFRTVVGVVFVGFTRPQFAPVCVARSSMLPVSIIVMVLDVIILGVLTIRIFTLGLLNDIREIRPSTRQEQGRALVYCTAGLTLWTLTSAAMMLGMESVILLLRTALPAVGLMVLVSILAIYPGALVLPRDEDSRTPEARSPFVAPPSQSRVMFEENNGSPVSEQEYSKTANLFVVNPSNTPNDSPTAAARGSIKADDKSYMRHPSIAISAVEAESSSSFNFGGLEQVRMSGGNYDAGMAAPLGATASAMFLAVPRKAPLAPTRSQIATGNIPTIAEPRDSPISDGKKKKFLFGWSKKPADKSVRGLTISNPVMENAGATSAQFLTRIKTVDLATAAASERERRETSTGRQLVAHRPAPRPPTMSASNMIRRDSNIKRKEVASSYYQGASDASKNISNNSGLSVLVHASSTSASLSPGREDVRRRSPRVLKSQEDDLDRSSVAESGVRNGINGLPVNPKRKPLRLNEAQQDAYKQDHLDIVKSVAEGSTSSINAKQASSSPSSTKPSGPTADSILNRPRPRRQNSDKDRAMFPKDTSQRHERSRSGSSVISKKSLMKSLPVSPNGLPALPPLPPVPTTASRLQKLLPNDTQDLTVDERISMMFPAPPGASQPHSRRSSVPSFPRSSSSMFLGDSFINLLTDQELLERRASKRSTISFGGQPVNGGVTPIAETPIINDYGIYRFTAKTYQGAAEATNISVTKSPHLEKRRSQQSAFTEVSSEADSSHDGLKSLWGSIHSPAPAFDVAIAKRTARETYIKTRNGAHPESSDLNETEVSGDGEGLMTVMLGLDEVPFTNRLSHLLDISPGVLKAKAIFPPNYHPWHRRIGDELPAFSQRRKRLRSRTMPPPTPLLLKSRGKQATVHVEQPVVETVLPSPEVALREIQEQLKKFEDPTRDSLGSLMRHLPQGGSSKRSSAVNGDKIGLLANLEKEMGQQENMWMQMQHNIDRDSNSVIMSPQMAEITPKPLPSPPSEISSCRSSLNSKSDGTTSPRGAAYKTQQSGHSRASIWQRRLTKAQREYLGSATTLSSRQSADFLAMTKGQLGSPTPPDSLDSQSGSGSDIDYETDEDVYEDYLISNDASPAPVSNKNALWTPKVVAPIVTIGTLWCPTPESTNVRIVSAEPAARRLRSALRRDQNPLTISSSTLWSQPSSKSKRSPVGLWGSRVTRPKSIITRPKTQRPQRKSKRLTCLPDILENPSPLPNKRDTLGIFQFPWGEKSDSAVYKPLPAPGRAILQPFLLNPIIEANARQPDSELTEYSSSFFDDYDDDYYEDTETPSDDDFDESTLWEIANLLNSEDVPSRNSLLPSMHIIEDYDYEENSELDIAEQSIQHIQGAVRPSMIKFVPIQPLKPAAPIPTTTAEAVPELELVPSPTGVWQAYLPSLDEAVRADFVEEESEEVPIMVNPRQLWDKAFEVVSSLPIEKANTLWSQKATESADSSFTVQDGSSPTNDASAAKLWTAREKQVVTDVVGLFVAGIHRTDYRTSPEVPVAIGTVRRARVDTSPLPTLTSQQLWSLENSTTFERHWISDSSIRAPSPSVGSASSSGRSTPSLDDASALSISTKASSLWSAHAISTVETSKIPVWDQGDVSRDAVLAEPEMAESPVSYLPNQSTKRPTSVRGSKVLASHELWESKAPILDANPSKTWRSSKLIVPAVFQEKKQFVRKAATAADWDVALEEAVSRGGSQVTAQKTRVLNQLWSASVSTTPQAPSSVGLWTAESASATAFKSLWTATAVSIPVKKATVIQSPITLPSLSSTSCWQLPNPTSAVILASTTHHWLHSTSLRASAPQGQTPDQALEQGPESEQRENQEPTPLELLLPNTYVDFVPIPIANLASSLHRSNTTINTLSSSTMSSRQTHQATDRKSIWTPPARAKTVSGRERRAGLWMPGSASGSTPQTSAEEVVLVASAMSQPRRRSSMASLYGENVNMMAGKKDDTEDVGEEGKEKKLWRPKWGLPTSPEQWLREGAKRGRKVEFRY